MNTRVAIALFGSLIMSLSCCTNSQKTEVKVCDLREVKRIFSYGTPDSLYGDTYVHYVLIRDFCRECMDSAAIVNVALKYIDTVSVDKPINLIRFFNSTKKFIPNEISQDIKEIDKDCLVTIGIDIKNKKPKDFLFYKENGDWLYSGSRWRPNGDGTGVYLRDD